MYSDLRALISFSSHVLAVAEKNLESVQEQKSGLAGVCTLQRAHFMSAPNLALEPIHRPAGDQSTICVFTGLAP